jgi:hypothetical protein
MLKPITRHEDIESIVHGDFVAFDPDYDANVAKFGPELDALETKLQAAQAAGNSMSCSTQIYIEARWLLTQCANWPKLEQEIERLDKSLSNPDQKFADEQNPDDGSWGPCYDTGWFFHVDAMMSAVNVLEENGQAPEYPMAFLSPIGTPEKMLAYMRRTIVSDISKTGVDNREELNAVSTVLSEICFKSKLRKYFQSKVKGFHLTDAYIAAYRAFIDEWQDSNTGYWGEWFQSGGKIHKSCDLSLTFHTISYLKGQVGQWPKIIDTTFAIKEDPYPYGWFHNGTFNNHNDYDIVKIFRYGWPDMSDAQKAEAADNMNQMLDWCLNKSMTPEGEFINDPTFYSSLGDVYYFGVAFLDEVGYFEKDKRFWTDQDFPESNETCKKILASIKRLGLTDDSAQEAVHKLEPVCGEQCA